MSKLKYVRLRACSKKLFEFRVVYDWTFITIISNKQIFKNIVLIKKMLKNIFIPNLRLNLAFTINGFRNENLWENYFISLFVSDPRRWRRELMMKKPPKTRLRGNKSTMTIPSKISKVSYVFLLNFRCNYIKTLLICVILLYENEIEWNDNLISFFFFS